MPPLPLAAPAPGWIKDDLLDFAVFCILSPPKLCTCWIILYVEFGVEDKNICCTIQCACVCVSCGHVLAWFPSALYIEVYSGEAHGFVL